MRPQILQTIPGEKTRSETAHRWLWVLIFRGRKTLQVVAPHFCFVFIVLFFVLSSNATPKPAKNEMSPAVSCFDFYWSKLIGEQIIQQSNRRFERQPNRRARFLVELPWKFPYGDCTKKFRFSCESALKTDESPCFFLGYLGDGGASDPVTLLDDHWVPKAKFFLIFLPGVLARYHPVIQPKVLLPT